MTSSEVLERIGSRPLGLTPEEAQIRFETLRSNRIAAHGRRSLLQLFIERFRSPLLLILVFAAIVAAVVQDWLDAAIVLFILIASALVSAFQEFRATDAVERLRRRVEVKATVIRGGIEIEVPALKVVPGDIVLLSAGSLIPADGLLLEARDLFISQAILTGETFPVEKQPGLAAPDSSLAQRNNCVFMGTSVRSGTGKAVAIQSGRETEYGQIERRLSLRPPETEFERGLRRFGTLLMRVMMIVVLAVLTINLVLQRPPIDTMLFAMALAVGMSPELLPAILVVTLSRGAQRMARRGVIVKQLNAIENLGSMDVLCTDKTGTLTRGVVQLDDALDVDGNSSHELIKLAFANSRLQTGLRNPLDEAVVNRAESMSLDLEGIRKLDEIPYDFIRKRLTIVVAREGQEAPLMITKGALQNVLEVCDHIERGGRAASLDADARQRIEMEFTRWSDRGFRVLGLASRELPEKKAYDRSDERELLFRGLLLFFDPPELGVRETLQSLQGIGVDLKVVTGDNHRVARHIANAVGLNVQRLLTGSEITKMKDEALWNLAPQITVFAEVEPNQKERIILALQKSGHVVGYLGDGINDAPALHAADAGISVDNAVDVAKDAADFVLLEHSLNAVLQGIDEGRHTFANTLKYIFITSSANFGNMISMAAASLFLPFLPMLAKQILLTNLLSDLPAVGIAGDRVDRAWERTPHRWDIHLIRNFMISFGLISTFFDFVTFGVLLYFMGEAPELFRTGWFLESLLTEISIVFIIRTYRPFYQSTPGRLLIWLSLAVGVVTLLLPYSPLAPFFGLVPLPPAVLGAIFLILAGYLLASEVTKDRLYQRFV